MSNYSIKNIATITGGKLVGNGEEMISQLIVDSRQPFSPEGSLFIALRGERHDGHNFILELYLKKGLRNFLVEKSIPELNDNKGVNLIIVDNSLQALQKIAAYHRNQFKCPVIAITGSNGKTIVKEWLSQLLHEKYKITRSPKSYNSQTGVPLSVWNLEQGTELAIFEAGISKHDEMKHLQAIIKPDIGIFTNIGEAHQENFLSYQRKIREKLILFRDVKTLLYCLDHDIIREEIDDWKNKDQEIITWSTKREADLHITNVDKNNKKTRITGLFKNKKSSIEIPFTDNASVENAIHCWLLMLYLKIDNTTIESKMLTLSPVAMRLEQKNGINNCSIINDSYNSDFHSLSIALDFLGRQQHPVKTLILSDILQSGKPEDELYTSVAKLLTDKKVQKLYGIGNALFANAGLFKMQKEFFLSTNDFIKQFHPSQFVNEAILLKGARVFEFEEISTLLELKSHRTTLEINLTSLVHNFNYFRSKLKPSTKIMVMVKAFSYGSGNYEVANLLEFHKADYLAVAFADEGVILRNVGISLPIVVMNPEEAVFRQMLEYNLEPEIYSFDILEKYTIAAKALQHNNYPVHIKLDTGMHRLGFLPEELPQLCDQLKKNEWLKVKTIFSHLAGSDETEHDDFTIEQADLFDKMSNKIMKLFTHKIDRHILNSSGIERFSNHQFDMVRLGIGLYGINPHNQDKLLNVSTLKTKISQIKTVTVGETIGYSRKGKVNAATQIGIIPIGYADGYGRKLGNGNGRVWIKGQFAPIIGNICMDMCMINLNGIDAKEGDDVELMGSHITIEELAQKMKTIPYEILTRISERVKRVYVQE
jgi:Alr-MurF fusion protein